ncbi:hypothetical protein FOMPIDRAFT_1059169 [Fomitopsis schrenkii]|uniref:Uncharacterized protein n=1 Tax=Fomitopsis schrenkii TaxID=2126942 RepID=S8FMV1_FOMSC|nr:hypothetical protein FOMPIDRAFT_1059169 [Fomitopsis schrenkii]
MAAYPPTPAEFEAYKARWNTEYASHKRDYDKWMHERAVFKEERENYEVAHKEHELDEENWVRQRQAYQDDTMRWRRAMDWYELAKRQWAEEQISWARERTRQQRAWTEKQARWAREREAREREWRDEAGLHRVHEGNTLGLSWGTVDAHQCVRYGTREYTARLGLDMQEACQHMPIVMNGEVVGVPHECLAEGDTLVGRWHVTESEVECRPSWGDLYDKGCLGDASGKRRLEARLWNLHDNEDWMTMCATTPADIRGRHFDSPMHCENRGAFYGMVGMWDVDDYGCK